MSLVDVSDQTAVEAHDEVVADAGGIDISFNAAGIDAVQEVPLVDLPLASGLISDS